MENNNNQSFWQFSDQLRVQTSNLANLSVNDSIWSSSYGSKRPDARRNFDIKVGGEVNSLINLTPKGSDFNGFNEGLDYKQKGSDPNEGWNSFKPKASEFSDRFNKASDFNSFNPKVSDFNSFNPKASDFNSFNPKVSDFNGFNQKVPDFNGFNQKVPDFNGFNQKVPDFNGFNEGWKLGASANGGINGGFNKGIYSKPAIHNNNINLNLKPYKNQGEEFDLGVKAGKKNNNSNKKKNGDDNNKDVKGDKKFKTLPPSESLPRNETIGGYIFVCNNDTMQENLKRQLFGLPPRYRDSVRAITPGLPLFLYNYSTHQLHGIFEAASFGGTNFDPSAWEDKKCPGESRFPAQVKVLTRKVCEPLEEDSFRPILHHYDGPKFRLELSVPEALSLLDIFADQDDIFVTETP
ncbi:putative development/cell death domain-containing protein [Rosa chinensis]|uniref:Putative development/cell death domain-containing protein n=1 Tax=Rosa chinensis TaxID=74649 RepID=A0A2P6P5Z8_ROSCH|nr:DCD domain-containing protein NRP-B [Rosa chinensis]PRQ17358.1 putative development/cell death domain-containing protein [Rosa chinensis]